MFCFSVVWATCAHLAPKAKRSTVDKRLFWFRLEVDGWSEMFVCKPFEHEIFSLDLPLALLAPSAPKNETKRNCVR